LNTQFLSNENGSPSFEAFLESLGPPFLRKRARRLPPSQFPLNTGLVRLTPEPSQRNADWLAFPNHDPNSHPYASYTADAVPEK
jgi:hypothetical protein